MLAAEGPAGELHVVRGLDVGIGEDKALIVPGVVAVFVPGAEVDYPGLVPGVFEGLLDEAVVSVGLEDDGDGLGQFYLGVPSASVSEYPVSMSGRKE